MSQSSWSGSRREILTAKIHTEDGHADDEDGECAGGTEGVKEHLGKKCYGRGGEKDGR